MTYQEITLKAQEHNATLYCYEHTSSPELPVEWRPALLVLPGGAYAMCSDREAEPIALEFFNRGYNTYVLKYPCAPTRYPVQLVAAATAMDTIRKRAASVKTNPAKVFAIGFSAGGHLCGSLANCPDDFAPVKGLDFHPNGVVLSYPVISEKYGHMASHDNLLGDKRTPDTAWLNLDESVCPQNPPAFIWATADDEIVPAINSLAYATAYNQSGLKYELHIFASGPHGLSLADERVSQYSPRGNDPMIAKWVDYADAFLRSL